MNMSVLGNPLSAGDFLAVKLPAAHYEIVFFHVAKTDEATLHR